MNVEHISNKNGEALKYLIKSLHVNINNTFL